MSLFQNSTTSLGHAGMTSLHEPRPVLKRSQTPYRPSAESKRRRTSPSGAFSRLSLSPNSTRPADNKVLINTSTPVPQVQPIDHQRNNENMGVNNTFQFGLNNDNQFPYTVPPLQSTCSTSSTREAKMKSRYSAYDLDSNRIYIESLSDGECSPTPSIQLDDDSTAQEATTTSTLELSPKLAHQLSVHQHDERNQSANILLNSFKFISDPPSSNHHQLVLYRKPIWPCLDSDKINPYQHKIPTNHSLPTSEPIIEEISDLDHQLVDSDQVLSLNPVDSMEID